MTAPIEANIAVQHRVWVPDASKDDHGNPTGAHAEPVQRYIQDFYPLEWETSKPDVISADYESRLESNKVMMVPPGEASTYKKLDLVDIGNCTYEVQNKPFDWGSGLPSFMQPYAEMLGGTVHVRRVT